MKYDNDNIFAKIIRGKMPCKKVAENDHALAFHDEFPKAPVHVLVVPKGAYETYGDFTLNASDEEVAAFFKLVGQVVQLMKIEKDGYRIISNNARFGGQEVYHFHMHVLGGCPLGAMLTPPR